MWLVLVVLVLEAGLKRDSGLDRMRTPLSSEMATMIRHTPQWSRRMKQDIT